MLSQALIATAAALGAAAPDPSRLPVGDGAVSTERAAAGSVFACRGADPNAPGAMAQGPWFNGDGTFDLLAKATVDGTVRWDGARTTITESGATLRITTTGVPSLTTTGAFPIAQDDDAYRYDRNPNAIRPRSTTYSVPARPKRARRAACLPGGPIGVTTDGIAIFNGLDAAGRDAVAHEVQDACGGHPEMRGTYHVHAIHGCLVRGTATSHSPLVGYALDGFAIFGPRGSGGALLANGDLDACHGHTHAVTIRGRRAVAYHYHATAQYPYTLGCFRGTPASTRPRAA